jgi:hypothetical protein
MTVRTTHDGIVYIGEHTQVFSEASSPSSFSLPSPSQFRDALAFRKLLSSVRSWNDGEGCGALQVSSRCSLGFHSCFMTSQSVLLTGASGCGKTSMAKCASHACQLQLIEINRVELFAEHREYADRGRCTSLYEWVHIFNAFYPLRIA